MARYDVTISKLMCVEVEADSEEEALEAMLDMDEGDFTLIDLVPVEATLVEELDEEE